MGNIIAEVTIVPIGTGSPSLSDFIAAIHREIGKTPSVRSLLTPMGTVLEGSWEEVMCLIRRIHEIPFHLGVFRVSTRITIDERRDKPMTMKGKLRAVEEKISAS